MGKGSLLKKLKSDLQSHDQLQHQKRQKLGVAQDRVRRQADTRALTAIRQAFNPFDAKYNRSKSEIGRGPGATRAGAPTATRSTAEKERQQVYTAHKQLRHKTGRLVDRRIGRAAPSAEERAVEYARARANRGKSFSIGDDFEEEFADEDGLDEFTGEDGLHDDGYGEASEPLSVSAGPLGASKPPATNVAVANSADEPPARPKTKAEVMQEVIAKSKMYKHERQLQQAADADLIDTLNADFDELLADLQGVEKTAKRRAHDVDEYDRNVQQLAFERRAEPQDRTKTAEELAREQKEQAEREQQAKLARMQGDDLDVPEDLDDVGARDDAEMFGLHDSESSDAEEPAEAAAPTAHAVDVPVTLAALQAALARAPDAADFVKSCVRRATPGPGRGDAQKLQQLCCAIAEHAITSRRDFPVLCAVLHAAAPHHGVGMALAARTRDLLHAAKARTSWGTDELLLFALVGSLFSTSDQWHVVVTSAMLVAGQRLAQSVDMAMPAVSTHLAVCDLLLAYQRFSKRYIPEVAAYLLRVLAAFNPRGADGAAVAARYIRLAEPCPPPAFDTNVDVPPQLGSALTPGQAVLVAAKLVQRAASLWRSLDAFPEFCAPLQAVMSAYQNAAVVDSAAALERLARFAREERRPLALQQFRAIGIVTRAPLFDENYNPDAKGRGLDPTQREQQKLRALLKKEKKSTLREIRRDTEFEARQQLAEKRAEMSAYHEKLRRLEGQINGEEGAERNAYERERKKRKRHY